MNHVQLLDMISLSLKQTALAVGAEPKWVLSAFARLGRERNATAYSDDDARWLRLARVFHREMGIPLPAAAALATETLLSARLPLQVPSPVPARKKTVLRGSRADGVRLVVDLDRFESTFQAALASALAFGVPRRAGRKPRAPSHLGAALAQARRKGIDLLRVRARMRHPLETRLGGRLPHELMASGGDPQGTAGQIRRLLYEIRGSRVRGVLVGELAEVVRGAAMVAPNPAVEICYDPSLENRRRVARLLYTIGARVGAVSPGFADEVTLTGVQVVSLETRLGRLVLRAIVPGLQDYPEVERRASGVDVFGINLAVLDLESLRRVREAAGTRRDVERLPLLDTMIAVPFVEARQREAAARS
jgi:hypothetical protein